MIGKQRSQQGFSLLEILIAFSILAFSLTILLNIFSGGLRRTMVSEEYQQAVIIAQSRLAAAGIEEPLDNGTQAGEIEGKYFWSVQVQAFNLESMGLDLEEESVLPYQVTVTVEWLAGRNNRQFELTTIKLSKEQ
ncbi:general secretion pathway protein I [Bathymodiolus platifrons methanotrophic gill symbiont]|uniref:type IV pilus modification PilV family protein n=1 Tax=Bathymodiolus platifrons methanotrophic gill symbiont TaxID=113268 RepID=UPI000B411749|nr:prepilin-type N-terminal cleavage/methylation domain-containing protein [Bathymodiolus platifrons methanotrophic gill symbiont]MCK5869626.1 prepilin-type N-terminal cleavage/methylation domain-containing protein [Methyloprofundus sp.]TXK94397.1 general secretion pathway protein GspH [Methylococcaceae bacterium CS4]TXK94962.1 general secretion pathway protein GspH [Methylococcaceae bacterium CS5]TXL03936.1 general secretion pathway protein GspH [Methylococcaceae bacterium CS3]TXL07848.1 gene